MGAFGGFTAAALHQILLLGIFAPLMSSLDRHIYDVILGVVIGAPIGFFPSYMEGLSQYSRGRAVRSGITGGLLGALGGGLAVPLSEILHNHLGGGILGRASAVGLLGLAVGIAEGANGGARWWRGIAGGLAGGIVAGALLEIMLERQGTYSDGAIVALILLGVSISLFISLFVNVLSESWLEGLPGSKIAGQVYQLSRFHEPAEALLGSEQKGNVFIWIPDAQERQTSITLTRKGAKLRHVAAKGDTFVNGHSTTECLLQNGDVIQVASSRLCYRERKTAGDGTKGVRIAGSDKTDGPLPAEPRKGGLAIKLLAAVISISPGLPAIAAPTAKVQITQVEMFHGNKARVYVSITDAQGNPLPDSDTVKLELFEAGKLVASQTVSEGYSVSSVLVLDLSGSMSGEKLRQARAAVARYVDLAPPSYRIALVGFSDKPSLISDFSASRSLLISRLRQLEAHGNTALQDAVFFALNLLNAGDRRTILLYGRTRKQEHRTPWPIRRPVGNPGGPQSIGNGFCNRTGIGPGPRLSSRI